MVIKIRQLLLRIGIAAAFLVLFAGLFTLLHREPQHEAIILETAAEREAWLNLGGWRVGEPESSAAVMPDEWVTLNGQRFLALQQTQGLSPEQFAGEAVMRYVYPVENGSAPELYAELWLCGDALCAALIYDAETQIMRPVR